MRDSETDFLIAIVSINITFYLLVYLHLIEAQRSSRKNRIIPANRRQFKSFCKLNASSRSAFFELNSLALICVFQEWISRMWVLVTLSPSISIMEFDQVLVKVHQFVPSLLNT